MEYSKSSPSLDELFVRRRVRARQDDQKALDRGAVTPEDLQRRNSLLPENFWQEVEIDWESLAFGKKARS